MLLPVDFTIPAVFLVACAVTVLLRRWAPLWGAVAKPRQDRWHRRPTALLGGVGIAAGLAVGLALDFREAIRGWPLLAASGFLFAVGLWDDLRPCKPYVKLVLQIVAASLLLSVHWLLPWTRITLINEVITLFWLVGVTNAFNLLDNMDGLAAGIALIAALFQAADFYLNGQSALALLPLFLAAAVAGFLLFNFPPASIFMGDSGSLLLGFFLAGSCLMSDWRRSQGLAASLLAPVLIMLVPIADTTLVTFSRKLYGLRASQGGRDHSSHRLVALGISERRAVVLLYGLAFACGGMALMLRFVGAETLFFLAPCFGLGFLLFVLRLFLIKVYPDEVARSITPLRAMVGFSYKRRFFEIALDLLLILLAYYGAFLFRFGGLIPGQEFSLFHRFVPLVLALEMLVFLAGGLYHGLWHYVGLEDLGVIFACSLAAAAASAIAILALQHAPRLSLSVLALNGILLLFLVSGSRISLRFLAGWLRHQAAPDPRAGVPVLIYGAGVRGELLARDLLSRPGYRPVGFLEDDPMLVGRRLHGIPIYSLSKGMQLREQLSIGQIFVSADRDPDPDLTALGIPVRYVAWTETMN